MFDIAIIGAGVNGSVLAYFLEKAGKKVAVFDGGGIASGGSGAAGAFISPKIAKGGDLKAISDEAFDFSLTFYNNYFPEYITSSPLLHLSKQASENEKVRYFKEHTSLHVNNPSEALMDILEPSSKDFESLYLEKSGVVDAKGICKALLSGVEFINEEVTELSCVVRDEEALLGCKDNIWHINGYKALHVCLATGAHKKLLDLPYIALRGVWGHRIDIETSTIIPVNIHQYVSISATKKGKAAIGATHDVHFHPQKNTQAYDIESGRAELLKKASQTIKLSDLKILKDYVGLRSGSNDYLPIIGSLVDVEKTIQKFPKILKGKKHPREELCYYPNLSMINGTGGYGFVLAPYLAKKLTDKIVKEKKIDKRLEPVRFFERWAKRV